MVGTLLQFAATKLSSSDSDVERVQMLSQGLMSCNRAIEAIDSLPQVCIDPIQGMAQQLKTAAWAFDRDLTWLSLNQTIPQEMNEPRLPWSNYIIEPNEVAMFVWSRDWANYANSFTAAFQKLLLDTDAFLINIVDCHIHLASLAEALKHLCQVFDWPAGCIMSKRIKSMRVACLD